MSLVAQFQRQLKSSGSRVLFHRDDSKTPCPCRTPEGYKDPIWHLEHTNEPQCNAAGFLSEAIEVVIRGFVQPIQSTRATRLRSEYLSTLFGEIQSDDHLGIFPCTWGDFTINFLEWGVSSEDWIVYNDRKFTIVNSNLLPDPSDGNPFHHWETAMRLIK